MNRSTCSPDDGNEEQSYAGNGSARDEKRSSTEKFVKEQTCACHSYSNDLEDNGIDERLLDTRDLKEISCISDEEVDS